MSVAVLDAIVTPYPAVDRDDQPPGAAPATRARLLKPGWPLAALFVPFPLWWVLGLQEWIFLILAVPMALQLVRRRPLLVPRGFGFWLLFLVWVAAGVVVLQVDAYGAVADDSATRYITWGYRLLWYLAVTTAGLYVVNVREELSTTRVARIMSAMFITIVAGGILGIVAPRFEFPSVMELILPGGLADEQFVYKMIHPTAAQLMEVLGYESPRPSAPFFFTNTWGLNIAVFLPYFLLGWTGKDAGWRRLLAPVVLVGAAVAIIISINRGLWLAVAAMALFMAVRAAVVGRPMPLVLGVVGAGLVVALIAFTSLGSVVQTRLTSEGSEQGRTNLGTLSVTSVSRTAPVSGLGSTRNVQGNFNTIAGGATADCPRCSPPALGTQGQLWLVLYSQGWFGLLFFLSFFSLVFLRHVRERTPEASVGLPVIVALVVTMPFYNSLGSGLMAAFIGVALMARSGGRGRGGPHYVTAANRSLRDIDEYFHPVMAYRWLVASFVVLGLAGGYLWQGASGTSAKATATVTLPEQPFYQDAIAGSRTIDTLAQTLGSDAVVNAAAKAAGIAPDALVDSMSLIAVPNTRILKISIRHPDATVARAAVSAAADAFVEQRTSVLEQAREAQTKVLRTQATALSSALATIDEALVDLQGGIRPSRRAPLSSTTALRRHKSELLTQVHAVNQKITRVLAAQLVGGTRVNEVAVVRTRDPWAVSLLAGALLGLLAGLAAAELMYLRHRQVRRGDSVLRDTGLAVLSRPSDRRRRAPAGSARRRAVAEAALLASSLPGATFLAVLDSDVRCVEVARQLNRLAPAEGKARPQVVIVSHRQSRIADLLETRDRLARWGSPVAGVVIL